MCWGAGRGSRVGGLCSCAQAREARRNYGRGGHGLRGSGALLSCEWQELRDRTLQRERGEKKEKANRGMRVERENGGLRAAGWR